MGTAMKSNRIEIQRSNITVDKFLSYIAKMAAKKGMKINFTREEFTNPPKQYLTGYVVHGGEKRCQRADYVKESGEIKVHHYDFIEDAAAAPCQAEYVQRLAYGYQNHTINWDGTSNNETCGFTLVDDKRGYGYYYQANTWIDGEVAQE